MPATLRESKWSRGHAQSNVVSQAPSDPYDLKLRSSATLFAEVTPGHSVFDQILEKYYKGEPDPETLNLLEKSTG